MLEDLTSRAADVEPPRQEPRPTSQGLGNIAAPSHWESVSEGESIVHLDLHPGNIKLCNGSPVVLNWGRSARGLHRLMLP